MATQIAFREKSIDHNKIADAIRAIHEANLLGYDRELIFRMDPATRREILQIVDRETGEVLLQLPPEHVLQIAETLNGE